MLFQIEVVRNQNAQIFNKPFFKTRVPFDLMVDIERKEKKVHMNMPIQVIKSNEGFKDINFEFKKQAKTERNKLGGSDPGVVRHKSMSINLYNRQIAKRFIVN